MSTTIQKIFSYSDDMLDRNLSFYSDKNNYTIKLEKLNAVIINAYINNQLNDIESEMVESSKFDIIMNCNPKTYEEFINLWYDQKILKKINIQIDRNRLINWKDMKLSRKLNPDRQIVKQLSLNSDYLFCLFSNKIKIFDLKTLTYASQFDHIENSLNRIYSNKEYLIYQLMNLNFQILNLKTIKTQILIRKLNI